MPASNCGDAGCSDVTDPSAGDTIFDSAAEPNCGETPALVFAVPVCARAREYTTEVCLLCVGVCEGVCMCARAYVWAYVRDRT